MIRDSRPVVELQVRIADCGYVCISAILALFGTKSAVASLKTIGGSTTRGLTLKQVRDVLRATGADAEAIQFAPKALATFPVPGILLLNHGHYIVLAGRYGAKFEAFYPERGWLRVPVHELIPQTDGLGVVVTKFVPNAALPVKTTRSAFRMFYGPALRMLVVQPIIYWTVALGIFSTSPASVWPTPER